MKRWIVPILCALAVHWALYRFDLITLPPVMAMPENRAVTISLVQMRPVSKPRPRVKPLKVHSPDPIAPLETLTPEPRPVKQPEPLPTPEPIEAALDEAQATSNESNEPLAYQATQESLSAPAGPDQAEVQASIPLYHLNPPPAYPAVARRLNYQGTVLLDVLVDPRGRVADVKVAESCGYSMLDRSAVKSVRRWRFEPARRFDSPIEMWVQVPIKFELR